jgi:hypothetical protein
MGTLDETILMMHGKKVYLDTNIFIYFTEKNALYFPIVAPIIEACMDRRILAITGEAAIAETMVHPYRSGDVRKIDQFRQFFMQKNFLSIRPHDDGIFDTASMIA